MTSTLTPEQQRLNDLWEEHLRDEFVTRDTEATLDTMVPDAYVNHVPVMTGGVGREVLRDFYSGHFIPKMPPDAEIVPVSRTIGADRVETDMERADNASCRPGQDGSDRRFGSRLDADSSAVRLHDTKGRIRKALRKLPQITAHQWPKVGINDSCRCALVFPIFGENPG